MPPEAEDLEEIDGWPDSDLVETARRNLGLGADADLPDEIRFIGGVAKLLKKRVEDFGATDEVAVFLLQPQPPEVVDAASIVRAPMLDNGLTPIGGGIWFVGPPVIQGFGYAVSEWDDGEVFLLVEDSWALGDVPAVVVDTRLDRPELRFYPDGISKPDAVEKLRLWGEAVSLEEVFNVINRAHETYLVTPAAQSKAGGLWEKPRKHHPSREAEARIQLVLRSHLQGAYPFTTIREEQTGPPGRLDLEIEEAGPEPGEIFRHVLLELKVLKSCTSGGGVVTAGKNAEAVRDGVKQAASYRDDRNVAAAALCCFDMRRKYFGEKCFDGVKREARQKSISLRTWHLFASAKAYRESLP